MAKFGNQRTRAEDAFAPYLLWVGYATVLNGAIAVLN